MERIVTLAHGAGGRASWDLVRSVLIPSLGIPEGPLTDAAVLASPGAHLAFTTDAFTVSPLFFPGGSIGTLAVYGTVNDLAVMGAQPTVVSLAIIAEEQLPMEVLQRVMEDVGKACRTAGVQVVTGDTKVVGRGAADKLFLVTSGIGAVLPDLPPLSPSQVRPGDAVLLSGTVGDHGVAVLMAREGLPFQPPVESDCAPITPLVEALVRGGCRVRWMRDPTRGGLAAVLNELAMDSGCGVVVWEEAIPLHPTVAAVSEILGLDPLHMANEGKLVAVVAGEDAQRACEALTSHPLGARAALIGRVTEEHPGTVSMLTSLGTRRILPFPSGELLPRIC